MILNVFLVQDMYEFCTKCSPIGSIHLSSEILWWPLWVTQAFRQPLPPPFGGVGPRCGSIAAFDGGPVERSLHQTSVDWCPSFARIPVISCVQDSPVSGISISLSLIWWPSTYILFLWNMMLGLNGRNDFIWSDIVIRLNCHMFLWERERDICCRITTSKDSIWNFHQVYIC